MLEGRTLNHQSAWVDGEPVEVVDLDTGHVGVRLLEAAQHVVLVGDGGVDLAAGRVAGVLARAARDSGRSCSASAARVCRAASMPSRRARSPGSRSAPSARRRTPRRCSAIVALMKEWPTRVRTGDAAALGDDLRARPGW